MTPSVNADAQEVAGPRPAVSAGIGVALLILTVIVFFDAQQLPPGSVRGVGPSAAMRIVAALLGVIGVAHLVIAFRRRGATSIDSVAPADRGNRAALAWVLGALVGLMLILQVGGGFIAASAWLFVLTARGFGAPIALKSIAIGALLSSAVYFFFTKALSLGLPAGPLEQLF